MDKLEHYLDQVCRSIGGPRSLRQHIRQELREHLRDAAAEHRAAGMTEQEALDRALVDFGGPDQVRAELEATHGHRLLPVVIDRALQWKEKTMKAKWLWATWAHLGLAVVIALEALLITFMVVFIIPRFQKIMRDGLIDPAILNETGVSWIPSFLQGLSNATNYTTYLVILGVAAWGLFEWRVRSENKSFIRLSVLGSAAVVLMIVASLAAAALLVSFTLGAPATGRLARQFAVNQISQIDTSVGALEHAMAQKDWQAMQDQADRASQALSELTKSSPAVPALTQFHEPPTFEETQARVKTAGEGLTEAQAAIRDKDLDRIKTAMQKFRQAFDPVREAAKRSPK